MNDECRISNDECGMERFPIADCGLGIEVLVVDFCSPACNHSALPVSKDLIRLSSSLGGMTMKTLLGCLLLFSFTLSAADVTGKCTGSFDITGPDGETKQDHAFMNLKQNGDEITGTAGPNEERQWPISKGKIEGDKITFEVQTDEPILKFDLRLIDGHLKVRQGAKRTVKR